MNFDRHETIKPINRLSKLTFQELGNFSMRKIG